MSGPELVYLLAGLTVGTVSGVLMMGVLVSGKVEDAERRLTEAGRESDEQAQRNARWITPAWARCTACAFGEYTTHGGRP